MGAERASDQALVELRSLGAEPSSFSPLLRCHLWSPTKWAQVMVTALAQLRILLEPLAPNLGSQPPRWVLDAPAPRPAAARTLASPFPQRTSTPWWASVGKGLSRVLRGPLESLLAQGREKVRSQSGQKECPSSVGLASGRLPPAGPAPRAPLHCPAGYFIHSRR